MAQGRGSFPDLVLYTSVSACLSGRHLESESNDDGGEAVCLQWTKQDQIPPIFAMPSAVPRDAEDRWHRHKSLTNPGKSMSGVMRYGIQVGTEDGDGAVGTLEERSD